MKRTTWTTVAALALAAAGALWAGEKAPQAVVDYVNAKLVRLGTDPVIVAAVKAENARGKTLDLVKAQDQKWTATAGIADYMKALMETEAAKLLRALQADTGFIAEAFVVDKLGANVAMTDKTSDYWQGDEAKFKNSFAEGAGAVFVDEVKFDDSTQTYVVQASFPVKDGAVVIGAITVGIDVDRFQKAER
jgi:hypothetical protein